MKIFTAEFSNESGSIKKEIRVICTLGSDSPILAVFSQNDAVFLFSIWVMAFLYS